MHLDEWFNIMKMSFLPQPRLISKFIYKYV